MNRIAAMLVVSILLLAGCASRQGALVGQAAPAFTLVDLENETVGIGPAAGQVLLLDFMGANCSTCRYSMQAYLPLYAIYGGENVTFLSVDVGALFPALGGKNEEELQGFRDEYQANWSFAMDTVAEQVALDYDVIALPTTYIIDRDGLITFKLGGVPTYACLERALNHTILNDYDGTDLRC